MIGRASERSVSPEVGLMATLCEGSRVWRLASPLHSDDTGPPFVLSEVSSSQHGARRGGAIRARQLDAPPFLLDGAHRRLRRLRLRLGLNELGLLLGPRAQPLVLVLAAVRAREEVGA